MRALTAAHRGPKPIRQDWVLCRPIPEGRWRGGVQETGNYGPEADIARIIGRTGGRRDSSFTGYAKGRTGEAYMEQAKLAVRRGDFRAAAQWMSRATNAGIPPDKIREAIAIQMRIDRGMSGR